MLLRDRVEKYCDRSYQPGLVLEYSELIVVPGLVSYQGKIIEQLNPILNGERYKQVAIRVELPDSLRNEYKSVVAREGKNMQDVLVVDFIEDYIRNRSIQSKKRPCIIFVSKVNQMVGVRQCRTPAIPCDNEKSLCEGVPLNCQRYPLTSWARQYLKPSVKLSGLQS